MKNQSSAGKAPYMSRASADGVSNMFSFNGTKSKRWADIESTLKGSQMTNSKPQLKTVDNANKKGSSKKPQTGGMKKMTAT